MMKKALNGNLRIAAIAAAVFAALILACSAFTADRAYAEDGELPEIVDSEFMEAMSLDDVDFNGCYLDIELNDYGDMEAEELNKRFAFRTDSEDFQMTDLDWDWCEAYFEVKDASKEGLYRCTIEMLYDSTASGDFTNATVISSVPVVI